MSASEGPFRDQDPVLSRLDKIDSTLDHIETHLAKPTPTRTAILAPWFGSPLIIIALAYAATLLFHSCDHGCAESDREKQEEADGQAAYELQEHERFCAAVGLRYAGTTPVFTDTDALGHPVYTAVVCGNGHGDGMYVGVDGHLHALKGQ